eukprot:3063868-Pleurochrysis_carterae.AAC.1
MLQHGPFVARVRGEAIEWWLPELKWEIILPLCSCVARAQYVERVQFLDALEQTRPPYLSEERRFQANSEPGR